VLRTRRAGHTLHERYDTLGQKKKVVFPLTLPTQVNANNTLQNWRSGCHSFHRNLKLYRIYSPIRRNGSFDLKNMVFTNDSHISRSQKRQKISVWKLIKNKKYFPIKVSKFNLLVYNNDFILHCMTGTHVPRVIYVPVLNLCFHDRHCFSKFPRWLLYFSKRTNSPGFFSLNGSTYVIKNYNNSTLQPFHLFFVVTIGSDLQCCSFWIFYMYGCCPIRSSLNSTLHTGIYHK